MGPSLLDRLTDSDARSSLRRDLTALLNTRRQERGLDPSFEQAADSVLTFGVVDFTSYNLNSSIDQERVRCSVERAVRQFEPRLTRVTVSIEQPEPLHPTLSLHIEAELQGEAKTSTINIDASLERASRRIVVQGAS